jgi:hypothetical protein
MSAKLTVFAFCLFLAGFGFLLFAFVEILMTMKNAKSRKFTGKGGKLWVRIILITFGVILIFISQSLFWFNSNLRNYYALNKNVPLAKISFRESEFERPRLILQTFDDKNRPLIADEIMLEDTAFQIEMEVIKFRKLGNMFGLNEVYRFSRIIYISDYVNSDDELKTTRLGNYENNIPGLIKKIRKIFPLANYKTVLTDPLKLDNTKAYEVTYNDLGIIELLTDVAYSQEE